MTSKAMGKARAYCKKCGLRADTKCPHCRSIFTNMPQFGPTDILDRYISVGLANPTSDYQSEEGDKRYNVSFWTYATSRDEAMSRVLSMLKDILADPATKLQVVACDHEWELWPGDKCHGDCGAVGPANDNIPADPFGE